MSSPVRIPDGFVDELKARIRPSDIIGRKVKLTKKGKEWVGLSPFTNEKTPSFYVNDQKRIFKCFSSGMGGDVISFIMETERLSFMEAVEKLAEEAGMELPKASPQAIEQYDHRKRLEEVCAAAQAYFVDRLHSAEGTRARDYLEGRGLSPDAWKRHGLGYSPDDWRRTTEHLKAEGFSIKEILEAGLAKNSDKGKDPYDAFRGRLMFPIADARGHVIAFGGRGLEPDAKPKYLNSGDTPLFQKSHVLYRYKDAREALGYGEGGGLIVCEGYMDAIALTEAGFENAVAPLGTALTEQQLDLLWRAGPEPVLCFDGDRAGLGAAHRAIERGLPHVQPGRSLFFVLLPNGMDPDDLIRARGRNAMQDALDGRISMAEMLWRKERDVEAVDTPEREAGLEARLMAAAATIRHPAVKSAYERDLRGRLRDYLWQARRAKRDASFQERARKAGPGGIGAGPKKEDFRTSDPGIGLLLMIAENPEIADGIEDTLMAANFRGDVSNRMRDVLFDFLVEGEAFDREKLLTRLESEGVAAGFIAQVRALKVSHVEKDSVGYASWKAAVEAFLPEDVLPQVSNSDVSWRQRRRMVAERHRQLEERRAADQAEKEIGKADIGNFWKDFERRNPWFDREEPEPGE